MTTHVRTRVYVIWSSHRGGKWLEEICFSEECAVKTVKQYKEAYPERNFRIEEKATRDALIWETEK